MGRAARSGLLTRPPARPCGRDRLEGMFYALCGGSWGAQLAAVTKGDSGARRSRLCPAAPTCCPSSLTAMLTHVLLEAGGRFKTSCQCETRARALRCQVGLSEPGSCEARPGGAPPALTAPALEGARRTHSQPAASRNRRRPQPAAGVQPGPQWPEPRPQTADFAAASLLPSGAPTSWGRRSHSAWRGHRPVTACASPLEALQDPAARKVAVPTPSAGGSAGGHPVSS